MSDLDLLQLLADSGGTIPQEVLPFIYKQVFLSLFYRFPSILSTTGYSTFVAHRNTRLLRKA